MNYLKKSFCWKGDKMRCYNGHVSLDTVKKNGYSTVVLSVFDKSGKGRSEDRRYTLENMDQLKSFN